MWQMIVFFSSLLEFALFLFYFICYCFFFFLWAVLKSFGAKHNRLYIKRIALELELEPHFSHAMSI